MYVTWQIYTACIFCENAEEVNVVKRSAYSNGDGAKVKRYDSDSVPESVEMMDLIGAGNNPMVGMTVAVAIEEASKQVSIKCFHRGDHRVVRGRAMHAPTK